MRRREFLQSSATLVGSLMAAPGVAAPGPQADRPNILLVLSDDHSAPHVGCYGNPDIKTPNLDRFAAEGIRMDRAYVACPQCVPSRATIMTGRSPVAIGMTRFTAPLPMDVRTYPEMLRQAGYYAGVAGRTFHLDGDNNPASEAVYRKNDLRTFARRLDYVKQAGARPLIMQQYREFLDSVPSVKPFFLQLCFSDPHRPLDRNAIPQPHDPTRLKLPVHYPDTTLVREDLARYYDEVARFDGDFGEVIAELERRGLTGKTLVAFMGDNGCSQLRGKGTLYEFGIHVPLLIRWPGHIKAGSTSAEMVSAEDLAPTFLAAAGVAAAPRMTGRSFLPVLQSGEYQPRECVFAERGAHGGGLPTNSANFDLARCVVTKTHKLIYNALWQVPYTPVDAAGDPFWQELKQMNRDGKLPQELSRVYFQPTRPMFELYDLQADPGEMRNLAGTPELAPLERELKVKLQEWMILERDYLPLPIPPPPARPRAGGTPPRP